MVTLLCESSDDSWTVREGVQEKEVLFLVLL